MNYARVVAEFLVDGRDAIERVGAVLLGGHPEAENPAVEHEHGTSRLIVSFEVVSEADDVLDLASSALRVLRAVASDAGLKTDCESMWSVRVESEQLIALGGAHYTRGERALGRAAGPGREVEP